MNFYNNNKDKIEIFWSKTKIVTILIELKKSLKIKQFTLLSMLMALM